MITTIAVALITAVIGPAVLEWVRLKFNKQPSKDSLMKEAIDLNQLVDYQLDNMMEVLECDRIWIAQFHNGGHFYPTGKSIAKFSVVYETVNIGVGSIQSNFQNIPVSLFSKSTNELLDNDIISIADYKDPTIETYGLKYVAEESNCKSGYLFSIKTIEDKFIGCLGIDYTKRKTKLDLESITQLSIDAAIIGGVLNNHLQK